ncbi:hypothetical protein QL285_078880 [Trifolium repens]|nr:hypothetical protein QL285_078880 [Trifolium repens]
MKEIKKNKSCVSNLLHDKRSYKSIGIHVAAIKKKYLRRHKIHLLFIIIFNSINSRSSFSIFSSATTPHHKLKPQFFIAIISTFLRIKLSITKTE